MKSFNTEIQVKINKAVLELEANLQKKVKELEERVLYLENWVQSIANEKTAY